VLPLSGNRTGDEFRVDGAPAIQGTKSEQAEVFLFAEVDADYFRAIRMALLAGRGFEATDGPKAAGVVVVNETFARRYFPDGQALGRTVHRGANALTVIGVARDALVVSLSASVEPFLFVPVAQSFSPELNLMVRSSADPAAVAAMIRNEVRALDPGLPRTEVTPLAVITSLALLPQRVAALVTGLLGLVGLLLAAVGLYGVIAYSMSQRGREIGVRMALGATAGNVVRMVLKESTRFVAVGLSIGLALALAATWMMKPFLFGVSATDATTYLAVSAVLAGVALLASYVPARRAAAADPVEVLRTE
jgi:predicted permease